MTRFVVRDDRGQSSLFPERLEGYLGDGGASVATPPAIIDGRCPADPLECELPAAFALTQLLLGVGERRFEHFADRLPRVAVELN